jgi:hypothetical protein
MGSLSIYIGGKFSEWRVQKSAGTVMAEMTGTEQQAVGIVPKTGEVAAGVQHSIRCEPLAIR